MEGEGGGVCCGSCSQGDSPYPQALPCDPPTRKRSRSEKARELMGHEDVTTTEIYTHVAKNVNGLGLKSPRDVRRWHATALGQLR